MAKIITILNVMRELEHNGKRLYVDAAVDGYPIRFTVEYVNFVAIKGDKERQKFLVEQAAYHAQARMEASQYKSLLGSIEL